MGYLSSIATFVAVCVALALIGFLAFDIRMHAIRTYGLVIHEFDPWFNFRAAQYLADNGMSRFFKWFDYMSWSPLGRPVGTTIYPGMQIASVTLWNLLNAVGVSISLNDVCCYTPVWFGVFATMALGALVFVVTNSLLSAVCGAAVMSIIPAHLMRSIGGGYDNESVAISAMMLTFFFWTLSLRSTNNNGVVYTGIITAFAYMFMVAAWGGYIFVLNMIGLHAAVLILLGKYSNKLYWAYSLWYILGTALAMQIPVVGWTPLKSLEQMAPALVFIGMQVLKVCSMPTVIKFMGYDSDNITKSQKITIIAKVGTVVAGLLAVVVGILWPTGYFGPLSARIRGLFVQHTRTGNPLVDSVAEHQPVQSTAFWQFLHYTCFLAPVGFVIAVYRSIIKPFFKPSSIDATTEPLSFVVVYAYVTYTFATKMNRLMLLMGPVSSVLCGIALGSILSFVFDEIWSLYVMFGETPKKVPAETEPSKEDASTPSSKKEKKGKDKKKEKEEKNSSDDGTFVSIIEKNVDRFNKLPIVKLIKKILVVVIIHALYTYTPEFYEYTKQMGVGLSHPSLMYQARLQDGSVIMVDDYREAYWWLRDHTPKDSRVMAWWDYGYQITGIGNRTTIADGNTWNHEHIALLGRCLTSPEKRAHSIIKHLADYVLIWAGGGGDDLAKSPHMARIGNSVFEDICPNDPTCSQFGFMGRQSLPTPMMGASLLYKLHQNRINPQVNVNASLFKEVFISKYGKVRIYKVVGVSKKSKKWAQDPANRNCDAPGSWYCTGNYPPALSKTIAKRKDFKQLEDFNKAEDESAKKYHEEYMKRMSQQRGGN